LVADTALRITERLVRAGEGGQPRRAENDQALDGDVAAEANATGRGAPS
jgi:hypothetical protein